MFADIYAALELFGFRHSQKSCHLGDICLENVVIRVRELECEITVVRPCTFADTDSPYRIWKRSCKNAEVAYFDLLNEGCSPQEARSVLPNSLKTEVVMTADLREWRHFLKLRCAPAAHPDMRIVANMLLTLLKQTYPVFFEDIVT